VGLPPDEIEIAEKSALWLKIIVSGKQSHAAHPEKGNNSLVAASAFVVKLRELYEVFAEKDLLFSPPISTFEPTKKEANVENVNTVPGRDVFYVDCRLLPQHGLKEVRAEIERRGAEIEAKYGVTIAYEDAKSDQRPAAISTDEEIVKRLSRAIEGVMGKTPRCVGIGGGTVAAILRKKGFPAAGWDPSDFAHEPNERSSVSMTIAVAKVMARALWGGRRIYLNGKNNGGRGMFAFRAILLGALKDIVTPENLPLGKFVRGPVRDSEKILFQKEAATTSKTA
jgi:succinyl-diaminopimelate desuccinylase